MTYEQMPWVGTARLGVISLILTLGVACNEQPLGPSDSPDFARAFASPRCNVVFAGIANDLTVQHRKMQGAGEVRLVCPGKKRQGRTFGARGTGSIQGIVVMGDPAGIVFIGDPAGLRAGRVNADVVGILVTGEPSSGFAETILEGSDEDFVTLIKENVGSVQFGRLEIAGFRGSVESNSDGTWNAEGTGILIDFTGAG